MQWFYLSDSKNVTNYNFCNVYNLPNYSDLTGNIHTSQLYRQDACLIILLYLILFEVSKNKNNSINLLLLNINTEGSSDKIINKGFFEDLRYDSDKLLNINTQEAFKNRIIRFSL